MVKNTTCRAGVHRNEYLGEGQGQGREEIDIRIEQRINE
jgi:hypothetical protein